MSSNTKPLIWLITGCSSGFGTALSLIALKNGHKVIATSRNPSKNPELVKQVESYGGIWLPLDITSQPSEFQKVIDAGIAKFGGIDVLVNNAGIAILGPLEDTSSKEALTMFNTNFFGPLTLIQTILPHFRANKSGTIVNISSAAGLAPRPSMGLYGASKSALETMSQCLQVELEPFGVRVLVIQPGAFNTEMMMNVTLTQKELNEGYENTDVGMWMAKFRDGEGGRNFVGPNDVGKGVQGIWEVVTQTGRGVGKDGILRVPISSDCAERTRQQIERLQSGHDAWKDIWETTKA